MWLIKKLPWFSLSILLLSHSIFGWMISVDYQELITVEDTTSGSHPSLFKVSVWLWLIGAVYILLMALAITAPVYQIRKLYGTWMKSDTKAFVSVIFSSFLAVIILRWIHYSSRILVLIAAAALTRLDLQTEGYGEWQAFWIICGVSLTGFSLGLLVHQLLIAIL
ncbi:MAG: hypothetical protein F6K10_26560 [Moorea sp. SIO2B7]|nr:hypothetical protein [Moorena sp. SIO2B7]